MTKPTAYCDGGGRHERVAMIYVRGKVSVGWRCPICQRKFDLPGKLGK